MKKLRRPSQFELKQIVRRTLAYSCLILIGGLIITIFRSQEMVYALPTSVPSFYREVPTGENIALPGSLKQEGRPVFLHFFNPDCPCSRFNLAHFKVLVMEYGKQVSFIVMVHTTKVSNTPQKIKERFNLEIPVVLDDDKKIAKMCGVYSTPQAVIIDSKSRLYFRGNYNRARYCTDKKSDFAQIALDSLLAEAPPPHLGLLSTRSYGCSLPVYKK